MIRYEWAAGVPFHADANKVQAEIERLRAKGDVTPEAVVAAARRTKSVLHSLIFDCAEGEAAERYYRDRAITVLNAIRIVASDGSVTHLRPNIRVQTAPARHAYAGLNERAARAERVLWLRRRLAAIKAELEELEVWPEIVTAIEDSLAA